MGVNKALCETVTIGDSCIPAPIRDTPTNGTSYWLAGAFETPRRYRWQGLPTELYWLSAGLMQATESGAKLQVLATHALTRHA